MKPALYTIWEERLADSGSDDAAKSSIIGGVRRTLDVDAFVMEFGAAKRVGDIETGELPPPKPRKPPVLADMGEIFSLSESADGLRFGLDGIRGAASFDGNLGVKECERVWTWQGGLKSSTAGEIVTAGMFEGCGGDDDGEDLGNGWRMLMISGVDGVEAEEVKTALELLLLLFRY